MSDTPRADNPGCQAVGAPVERPVRPWGTRLDLDAQPVGYDRRQGDILRWREPQVGPLYDQAALDAAVAAERAESARLRHLLNLARDDYNTAAQRLQDIGDYAHDHSTGPAVPDALWEVRSMAYGSGA